MLRLVLLITLVALGLPAQAAELRLVGLDGQARTVTDEALKAMPRVRLKLDEQEIAPFEGVALRDILARTGVLAFEEVRGPLLAVVMVFRASDGYVVALPLADLDPAYHRGRIVVADTWNDQPLSADEGPYRLIVEGEARPARSAHSLVSVELRSLR